MKKNRKYERIVILLLLCSFTISLLGGCGSANETTAAQAPVIKSMEDTAIVNYTLPEQYPNIMVSRLGYSGTGDKVILVKGSKLPEEFRAVNVESGEIVYRGRIEDIVFHPEKDQYSGYIDLTRLETEGTYYLECDYLGRSYDFSVETDLYQELYAQGYLEMVEKCEMRMATIEEVMTLLLIYELHPEICTDENANEIPDILDVTRSWIAGIDYSRIDVNKGALYAAFLGKFSYLYQKYDYAFATECVQRGSTIFNQTQDTMQKSAEQFWALTELYRATGLANYGSRVLDYKDYFNNNSHFLDEEEYLYGAMTYMVTRQKVDVELCELCMDKLLERGEEIAERAETMLHPVDAKNNGVEDILQCAKELSCANYVVGSYQNDCIMEDFLYYLSGENLQSVHFEPEDGQKKEYLLLLAHLAAKEGKH